MCEKHTTAARKASMQDGGNHASSSSGSSICSSHASPGLAGTGLPISSLETGWQPLKSRVRCRHVASEWGCPMQALVKKPARPALYAPHLEQKTMCSSRQMQCATRGSTCTHAPGICAGPSSDPATDRWHPEQRQRLLSPSHAASCAWTPPGVLLRSRFPKTGGSSTTELATPLSYRQISSRTRNMATALTQKSARLQAADIDTTEGWRSMAVVACFLRCAMRRTP